MRRAPWPELALVGMTVGWGLSFVVVPWTLADAGVMTTTALRGAIAVAVLLALRPTAFHATALEWRAGILGGLILALGYALQTAGLLTAGAGKGAFLTAFYVSLVPAVEAAVYRRAPAARDVLVLLVATAGIAVMVVRADLTLDLAEGLIALSAIPWAAQIVLVGRVANRTDPLRLSAIQMFVMAVACTGGAFMAHDPVPRWNGGFVAGILFLGVVTNALAFLVQAWGQRHVSPTRTAILFSTEPVFGVFFGWWLRDEHLGVRDYAGAAIVMAAVAFTVLLPRNDPSPVQAGS